MLKLEKASKLSNVTIRMRERERFFEPRLLKALTIALLLHCGAFVMFHVTPFSFTSTFVFPPVLVQSDSTIKGVVALVSDQIEKEELLYPPLPFIPPLEWISSFLPESILIPSYAFDSEGLESLEKQLWPKWEAPLSLKLEEPRIQLNISGPLAELSMVASDPLLEQMQPISSHDFAAYVTYQVLLDDYTGEIFWHERIESSIEPAINQLTEKILLNLRFSSQKTGESVAGFLNFLVLPSIQANASNQLPRISHKILKKSDEMPYEIHRKCARDHYQVDMARATRAEDRMTGHLNFSRVCSKYGLRPSL